MRWADTITHASDPDPPKEVLALRHSADVSPATAARRIHGAWRRWLARRAGPLLWYRAESNNPADFYSADPVEEMPLRDIVSFVDGGKGYIMDIKSATSLLEHAAASGETPLNPFNRAVLPALFLRRVARRTKVTGWGGLQATTEEQRLSLLVTDVFRGIEDLGYYTDPGWFLALHRIELQRIYIELADIWFHRAGLTDADRIRVAPGTPFGLAVRATMVMQQRALRILLLNTFRALTTTGASRGDRQTGVMYALGALSLVSRGCATAYPWLVEMFAPGVARIVGGAQIIVLHPAVLNY